MNMRTPASERATWGVGALVVVLLGIWLCSLGWWVRWTTPGRTAAVHIGSGVIECLWSQMPLMNSLSASPGWRSGSTGGFINWRPAISLLQTVGYIRLPLWIAPAGVLGAGVAWRLRGRRLPGAVRGRHTPSSCGA